MSSAKKNPSGYCAPKKAVSTPSEGSETKREMELYRQKLISLIEKPELARKAAQIISSMLEKSR